MKKDVPSIYPATYLDSEIIFKGLTLSIVPRNNPESVIPGNISANIIYSMIFMPCFIVDLPISIIVDTLLLPVDLCGNKSKEEKIEQKDVSNPAPPDR